jgi:hypothetical protein
MNAHKFNSFTVQACGLSLNKTFVLPQTLANNSESR